jgi:hypothetical protein
LVGRKHVANGIEGAARPSLKIYLQLGDGSPLAGNLFAARGRLVRLWKFIRNSGTARPSPEIYVQLGDGSLLAGNLVAARGRFAPRWKFICSSGTVRASLEDMDLEKLSLYARHLQPLLREK